MTQLARKLGLFDYFALGFGTTVGVGWLVVMDDWLSRGGPLGAILGFVIGGAAVLPIGYVYGRLVIARPDAAGEIAYTAEVFPQSASFSTGWIMLLSYISVCPWEAVAIGKIAAYIFPALDSHEVYRLGSHSVYLPHLVVGSLLIILVTVMNYRGVRLSATFQTAATLGLLLLFVVFGSVGLAHGAVRNFTPLFSHSPLVSVLLVMQIVPYFMTGFESIGKASEEARPEFQPQDYMRATLLAIVVAIFFYAAVITVVAFAQPWPGLVHEKFATAAAIEHAVGGHAIVNVVLLAALISLGKVFNGAFIAATRLLFALGRRGLVGIPVGSLHPVHQTPAAAVLVIGAVTTGAMLLGDTILIPVTEVGSIASAFGWMMACAAYFRMNSASRSRQGTTIFQMAGRRRIERLAAAMGAIIGAAMIIMKLLPFLPGHFTIYEYVALVLWFLAGVVLRHRRERAWTQLCM